MDSQELERLVRQPEESAKLDFKIEPYKIYEPKPTVPAEVQKWADAKEQQWAELVKDVLAVTNGNIGTAHKTAYLIIGADDKLKPDGTPNLRDVGDKTLTRKEIYEKVNSYCQPRLPDLQCDIILLEGKRLLVISIPPSPYLHRLSKQLKTPKKEFSPHTVLMRRGDGEEIYEASSEEQKALEKEKQALSPAQVIAKRYENIRLTGVTESEFFGREQEIERLNQLLQKQNRLTVIAIVGMGGVGKTELAIQYARQHFQNLGSDSGGVCWIDGREGDVSIQLIRFAESFLNLKLKEDWDLKTQLRFCWQNWSVGDWLIVIDDVTDYRRQVKPYLPPESSGFKVLLTTREKIGRPVENLPIRELRPEAARELLQSLIDSERIEQEPETAQELCEWLGYLPLGLELVGRYLEHDPDLSLRDILSRLQKKGLEHRALVNTEHYVMTAERGVAAAFELSWERLDENAQHLGCLLSLFALADIPWDLVKLAYANLPSSKDGEIDQDLLEEARNGLLRFNLLQRTGKELYRLDQISKEESCSFVQYVPSGEGTYQLHPLIHEFFREKRDFTVDSESLKRAVTSLLITVVKHIPHQLKLSGSHILAFAPVVPHAIAVVENKALRNLLNYDNLIEAFRGLSNFYEGIGLYAQSKYWILQSLSVTHTLFGEGHPAIAAELNNLALLCNIQGRYDEAESLHLESLQLIESLLEESTPNATIELRNFVGSSNNLAMVYYNQGCLEKAKDVQSKALEISKSVLADDGPLIATILNNMGMINHDLKLYNEAEDFYFKALELRKQLFGEDSPEVASSLNNLASLYQDQNHFDKAESYYLNSLELNKIFFLDNHPNIADTLSSLGTLYICQKRFDEAELHLNEALDRHLNLFGKEHPDVATSLSNLATLYVVQRQFIKAEPLLEQAVEIYEKFLGENNSKTIVNKKALKNIRDAMIKQLSNHSRVKKKSSSKQDDKGFGKPGNFSSKK